MSSLKDVLQVLLVIFAMLPQESWCRYMSLSLNFTMAMSDERHGPLSVEIIGQCMRQTEMSMADLQRFRQSIQTNEQDQETDGVFDDGGENANGDEDAAENANDNNGSDNANSALIDEGEVVHSNDATTKYLDYEQMMDTDQRDESLHCFTHCLYEKLGVIKNDFVVEEVVYRKLLAMLENENGVVPECNRLGSSNKCEATYKLHMCYNRLKFMEAERRIRKILESGNFNANGDDNSADNVEDKDLNGVVDDTKDDGDNDVTYDDDYGNSAPDMDFSTNEIEN